MDIRVNLDHSGIAEERIAARRAEVAAALQDLWSGTMKYTGWIDHPNRISEAEMVRIEETAGKIRRESDVLLVLGAGGSYMGAKAVIDLLQQPDDALQVLFAGYNFSGRYMRKIFLEMEDKDVSLCIISKSGSTMETLASCSIYEKWMRERYGEAATERMYVITESETNMLGKKAREENLTLLLMNPDIGGRYSVMTAVGLLPIAAAGIDIRQFVAGAKSIAHRDCFTGATDDAEVAGELESAGRQAPSVRSGNHLDYAIVRQELYRDGKVLEAFESFDPFFDYFGEWLIQLFGESEGKEQKGIFPTRLIFSRDLHSMGQFLQQGTECFFETLVHADRPNEDLYPDYEIPDGLMKYLTGKTVNQINRCAQQGVWDAHVREGIPAIEIVIPMVDAYYVGELMYFFEVECAVSSLLAGVYPFDQPGVEAYKEATRKHIREL